MMPNVLPDLIARNLRIVFTGTAAGSASARAGAYYAGPGNAFWATLYAVGLTPRRLAPSEFRKLLEFGIGLTDLCKVTSGSDQEIVGDRVDIPRFLGLVEANRPRIVAFNGKRSASVVLDGPVGYGRQPGDLDGAAVWVLPSTAAAAWGYWDLSVWHRLTNDDAP
jgi:TDG/mug DNA glycosylase family protein